MSVATGLMRVQTSAVYSIELLFGCDYTQYLRFAKKESELILYIILGIIKYFIILLYSALYNIVYM